MKPLLKTALCAIMLMTLLIPGALAQEKINQNFYVRTNYRDPKQTVVRSTTVIGDKLYLLTDNDSDTAAKLECWQMGMGAPESLLDTLAIYDCDENGMPLSTNVSMLFTDGKLVYGYNTSTGDVCILADETGRAEQKPLYQLDISGISEDGESSVDTGDVLSLFAQDGVVYLLNRSYGANGGMKLVQYDFVTGEQIKIDKLKQLEYIAPYKEGKLLCLWQELDDPYDEETQTMIPSMIAVFDPKTAEATPIAPGQGDSDTGLCYDARANTLYFISSATIYSLPDMRPALKISGYVPTKVWRGGRQGFGILSGSNFVYGCNEGVYIRGLDMPGVENGALTIVGEYGGMEHNAVITKHPEIAVIMPDSDNDSMESCITSMLSGEAATDIFKLNTNNTPVSRLIAKGYAAELNDFPEIMAVAQRLDKRFTEALSKDGKLYGLPLSFYANNMGYNKQVWEESLGLTESDLPKTFVELLDFIANYYADYGEDRPEINVYDNIGLRSNLLQTLMEQYVAYQMKTEGDVKFDTPLFRKLMDALNAIDFTAIDPYAVYGEEIWNDQSMMDEFWGKTALFTGTFNVSSMESLDKSRSQEMAALVLPLDAGMEPVICVNINAMIINPRSTRMAQAGVYLGEYAQHYDEADAAVTMFPDNAQAVPNRYFEDLKKSAEAGVARMQKRLETASEENRANLKDELKWKQEYLANLENQRMIVTDEMIAEFREKISPYLYLMRQNPLTDGSSGSANNLQTQMRQFCEGAIDTDKFIREIDKRVKMMLLEDQ